jgi:hypothetical protein
VGSRELRPRSVGASELKAGAVTSRGIRNRGVRLSDLSLATRHALHGVQGPPGPTGPGGITLFAIVDSGGGPTPAGVRSSPVGINGRVISFDRRSVASCAYSATLAKVSGGAIEDPPPGASITVAQSGDGVLVRTWDASNQPKGLPFHLIVAC